MSTKETKATFLDDYRIPKKAQIDSTKRSDSNVGPVTEIISSPHPALLRATFSSGEIGTDVTTE